MVGCVSLLSRQIEVELKNDVIVSGTLLAVDQFLNLKLDRIQTDGAAAQLSTSRACFVRGSTVRYSRKKYLDTIS